MTEHDEQAALISWARLQEAKYPELGLLAAIPNGARTSMSVARRLKCEGLNPGIPDLILPVARRGWHGLFVELKYGHGKPSDRQIWWADRLAEQGYLAVVCWGWIDARNVICEYLEIGEHGC